MKKYTHAWLAFMAVKRLEQAKLAKADRRYADILIEWFRSHKDGVLPGAWYPDSVIKDMANSHVLKITPSTEAENKYRRLPATYLNYQYGTNSPVKRKSFTVEKNDNLPERCESLAHSVIDHLKIQESEDKGSPVSPTDNQVALLLFMLSHYIADAHVPFHCDSRRFSEGMDLHGYVEGLWDDMIKAHYQIDEENERFFYDPFGYPLRNPGTEQDYQSSPLKTVTDQLSDRKFIVSWGVRNNNVGDFMTALCQHSYLLSYCFIPEQYDHTIISPENWQSVGSITFEDFSAAVLSDAIDSIARVWLRVWRRYLKWERKQKTRK